MATARVTKRAVDALSSAGATAFLWDDELRGFGVRVTPGGAKSYVYQYRLGGREALKKRATIGRHGSPWTPETARKEAVRLAHMVGQGIDPVEADKARRRATVTLAFGGYAQRFTDDYLKTEWPGGWQLADGILRREAVPAFKGLALPQITRSHVVDLLDGLAGRPAVRRNAFAVLRRMFRWAVSRGDLLASPMIEMDPPAAPAARDRVLSDVELARVWAAADTLDYPFGPMIRLLIATGQRREEVAGLTWGELDRKAALWTLPAARSKNGQAHLVPLSPVAMEAIDSLAATLIPPMEGKPVTWPRKGLVFSTTGKTAVSGYSRAKARLDVALAKTEAQAAAGEEREPEPVPPWRLHDLRRTAATGLQRLGIRFEVTEAVLNHVSGAKSGVAGVYQRHDWKDEKRAALDAWGRHVASMARPAANASNVVALDGRRTA